jgi:hypothetical protein
MWDEDFEEDYSRINFTFRSKVNGVTKDVSVQLKDVEYYPQILQEFVYFLQSMGFTYIAGLTAFDDKGMDMKSSEDTL